MARVTIEDCLLHVPNRFDLVILASKRARQLLAGAEPLVPINDDKVTVLALREIAAGVLDLEALARFDPRKKRLEAGAEEELTEEVDLETQSLMDEEIHLPGVNQSENEFSDDEDFGSLSVDTSDLLDGEALSDDILDDSDL